jgi:hypothetical protein
VLHQNGLNPILSRGKNQLQRSLVRASCSSLDERAKTRAKLERRSALLCAKVQPKSSLATLDSQTHRRLKLNPFVGKSGASSATSARDPRIRNRLVIAGNSKVHEWSPKWPPTAPLLVWEPSMTSRRSQSHLDLDAPPIKLRSQFLNHVAIVG